MLEVHGQDPVAGRDAIRAYLGGVGTDLARDTTVPLIRHHVSNLRIEVVSPTEARGACYFLAVTERGVDHWGRYRDHYVPRRRSLAVRPPARAHRRHDPGRLGREPQSLTRTGVSTAPYRCHSHAGSGR